MCGRITNPFVMIGDRPVGPKCAKRAGMVPSKLPKGHSLKFVKIKPALNSENQTLDLFENDGTEN